jgi:hypothetical protein
MVLYKSFNTLWLHLSKRISSLLSMRYKYGINHLHSMLELISCIQSDPARGRGEGEGRGRGEGGGEDGLDQ